jgi:hypothetical protein
MRKDRWSLIFGIACGVSALTLIAAIIIGCATADPATVSKNGCAVDLKRVCQYVVDSGEVISTQDGVRIDRQRLQNLSVRHLEVLVPFRHGSGTLLRCVVDSQSGRVSQAGIAEGPQFNDADMEHLRQAGLCQ